MKNRLQRIILAILIISIPVAAWATTVRLGNYKGPRCRQTAPATADAAAVTGPAVIHAIQFKTDGTNAITLTMYDNTAASGTVVGVSAMTIDATVDNWIYTFDPPLYVATALYVDLTCAGTATYVVFYDN